MLFKHPRTILFSCVVGLMIGISASSSAQDLSEQFQASYANLRSVSCVFEGGYGITGSLTAAKGKGYRIELPTRSIVSNNKLVWNAEKKSKTVIVNQYNPSNSDVSLDQVFFVLFNVYAREIKSVSGKTKTVRLFPANPTAMIAGVSEVLVFMDAKLSITKISLVQDGNASHWNISKLKRNGKYSPSVFVYTLPKGWTVIDLTK